MFPWGHLPSSCFCASYLININMSHTALFLPMPAGWALFTNLCACLTLSSDRQTQACGIPLGIWHIPCCWTMCLFPLFTHTIFYNQLCGSHFVSTSLRPLRAELRHLRPLSTGTIWHPLPVRTKVPYWFSDWGWASLTLRFEAWNALKLRDVLNIDLMSQVGNYPH